MPGGQRLAGGVAKPGRHPLAVLREADQPVAQADPRVAQPLAGGTVEQALQPAAVDRELRPVVAGLETARLAPDPLPEAVAVDQLPGPHAGGVELRQQAQRRQLLDRVRQEVDADPEFAHLRRLLEDLDLDAPLGQAERCGQPADPAAVHQRAHCHPSPVATPVPAPTIRLSAATCRLDRRTCGGSCGRGLKAQRCPGTRNRGAGSGGCEP